MPRYTCVLSLLTLTAIASASLCLSQTPAAPVQPTAGAAPAASGPAAAPQTTGAQSTPGPTSGPVPTIRANAQLVVVDVTVMDNSHKPVHGLKSSDFTVNENGAPQTVKIFEEHTAPSAAEATHFAPMPTLPPDVFSNYSPVPENGSVDLLLLDTLNTPITDQTFVRQQLLAYLKTVPPGTRIAIFGLSEQLFILQGFTTDPAVLRTVLEKDRGRGSPLLADPVGGGSQNSMADDLEDNSSYESPEMIADIRQFEAEDQSFQLQMRIKFTLDALSQLARYLANIPGRKNLVWFSGSFPVSILPDSSGELTDPFAVAANYEQEFRETVDLLGRSQVAVYPVDARGLATSPIFDATTTRNYGGKKGNARLTQDETKFITDKSDQHGTMKEMAYATGGEAFVDTNDLTHAVANAIDQGSNFYTLAYAPSDLKLDGRMRKIKIDLSRSGLTLSYRHGYYADPPDKTTTDTTVSATTAADPAAGGANGLSPRETMRLAMMRGAPTPTDIQIRTGVLPMSPDAPPEDAPAPGNVPSAKEHGPWRRYSVNYQINPADLVFYRTADGKVHADFELLIFVYSADGTVLNMLGNAAHISDSADNVRQLVKQGVFYHEQISAPAKGESFLRIAVHDLHRDHYGAVEVATSEVKNVAMPQPAAPAPAAPTAPAATQPAAAPATGTQK